MNFGTSSCTAEDRSAANEKLVATSATINEEFSGSSGNRCVGDEELIVSARAKVVEASCRRVDAENVIVIESVKCEPFDARDLSSPRRRQ